MFSNIRIAFGSALLLTLLTSMTVFAKGNFYLIVVTGAGLKDEVRILDDPKKVRFGGRHRRVVQPRNDPLRPCSFAFQFGQNRIEIPSDRVKVLDIDLSWDFT